MAKLKSFTDKYDLFIFDLDGVITSEQGYWYTAALTVYELMNSNKYFGTRTLDYENVFANRKMIRKFVLSDDKTIVLLKNKGVNSNTDLAYIVFCASVIKNTKDPEVIYNFLKENLSDNILNDYERLAILTAVGLNKPSEFCMRTGTLREYVNNVFQGWYLGEGGRPSILNNEQPLLDMEKTREVLKAFHSAGKTISYGTGRFEYESKTPLSKWDFYKYFSENHSVTYDEVSKSEQILKENGQFKTLTKPDPYVFLQGALGKDYPVLKIINGDFDKELIKKTLVIGDAGADILSAHAGGFDFCAVLTGISGEAARPYFEEQKAEYILDSIFDFIK